MAAILPETQLSGRRHLPGLYRNRGLVEPIGNRCAQGADRDNDRDRYVTAWNYLAGYDDQADWAKAYALEEVTNLAELTNFLDDFKAAGVEVLPLYSPPTRVTHRALGHSGPRTRGFRGGQNKALVETLDRCHNPLRGTVSSALKLPHWSFGCHQSQRAGTGAVPGRPSRPWQPVSMALCWPNPRTRHRRITSVYTRSLTTRSILVPGRR